MTMHPDQFKNPAVRKVAFELARISEDATRKETAALASLEAAMETNGGYHVTVQSFFRDQSRVAVSQQTPSAPSGMAGILDRMLAAQNIAGRFS